jgi:asparagine synthase (glutamine-hydrolysing)
MDIHTYLPSDILTKVDIASMMSSLETRTPIVDVRVMEFAGRIPEKYNMVRQADGTWSGKTLLKKLMERYYPKDFLYRKKQGFSIPAYQWFGEGGAFRKHLENRMASKDFALQELFDKSTITAMIQHNLSHQLWTIVFLEEWLRQHQVSV